jgi:hypothetical protein
MKTQSEIQVKHDLDQCVAQMKNLLKQMEPAQRLAFINELTIQLMPARKKTSSSSEKINARINSANQGLSHAQMQLIKKVSDDTDRLFDFDSDHRA